MSLHCLEQQEQKKAQKISSFIIKLLHSTTNVQHEVLNLSYKTSHLKTPIIISSELVPSTKTNTTYDSYR
jgi:thiamine phosphate synthase YjbQ (UPF0047 family)